MMHGPSWISGGRGTQTVLQVCAALAFLTMCTPRPPTREGPPGPAGQQAARSSPAPSHSTPGALAREPQIVLTLYFPNSEYTRSGNESEPHLVVEERRVKSTAQPANAALRELLEVGPRTARGETVPSSGARARVARIVDGIATVDFSGGNLNGGSLAETMVLSALVWTLTEFATVESVLITVEGRPVESLFGHVDTSRPLVRADFPR